MISIGIYTLIHHLSLSLVNRNSQVTLSTGVALVSPHTFTQEVPLGVRRAGGTMGALCKVTTHIYNTVNRSRMIVQQRCMRVSIDH